MSHAATHNLSYSVNMDSALRKVYLNDIFATDDCCAHRINLLLYKDSAQAQLSAGATVKGYFIRYKDNTTVLIEGELKENIASVKLPKACYTQSGQFALVVKLMEDDVISTIFYGEGTVFVANTGAYVDPDNIIPSLDDLLARIAEMEAATAEAREAAIEARSADEAAKALAQAAGEEAKALAQAAGDEAKATAQEAANTALEAATNADAARLAIQDELSQIKNSKADAIVSDASGSVITFDDASNLGLHGLRIFGRTTQDGTPSPDAPVPLVSAGDGGSVSARICGKNLLNYDAWKTVGWSGRATVVFEDNGVTLTAATDDTYTEFIYNEKYKRYPDDAVIPVVEGEEITLSWEADTDTPGMVYIFGNGSDKDVVFVNNNVAKKLTYTVPSGITYITFRVGVKNAGDTIAYKNIQIERGAAPTPFEPYKSAGTLTLSTPNGLPGITVSSGGNYTDENGQQWVCDEIDLERGVYVQRILKCTLNGDAAYGFLNGNVWHFNAAAIQSAFGGLITGGVGVCDRFIVQGHSYSGPGDEGQWYNTLYIANDGANMTLNSGLFEAQTAQGFMDYFAANPTTIYALAATPVETPLSDAEITAYKLMHSVKPNTTLYNDAGAYQVVEYAADTKIYIDKKFDALAAALLS